MPIHTTSTEIAVRHGRDKKRKNAIAALLCGAVPAVLLSFYSGSAASWELWFVGFIVGLIWGDAFEYVYHRWLLHRPRSPLGTGHHEHHAQIGTPEQAEHVALISSPVNILLLFVINGVPAFLVASPMGPRGILSGVFIGWTVYLIVTEEIHWRIHMNGWLPPDFGLLVLITCAITTFLIAAITCFYRSLICCLEARGGEASKVPVQPAGNQAGEYR